MHRSSNPKRFILPPHLWRLRPLQLVVIDLSDWLFPWVIINLLWVVCSLTVVLLPPATAALFSLAERSYRNEAPTPRRFWAEVRRSLVQSWLWALVNGAIFVALFLLARAVYPAEIPLAVIGVLAAMLVLMQFFLWPYMALQEKPSLTQALRNSVFTTFAGLPYLIGYVALTLFILVTSIIVIAPMLLITPVVLALMTTYGLIAWLEQHNLLQHNPRNI
jgi:uncharacterized membrane protein YesL